MKKAEFILDNKQKLFILMSNSYDILKLNTNSNSVRFGLI